jgi:hypothetical protein
VLFLPVFVVELFLLSLFVEALTYGVLCGVFISLFPVKFLLACTHVLTLCQTYYSGYHYLLYSFVLLLVPFISFGATAQFWPWLSSIKHSVSLQFTRSLTVARHLPVHKDRHTQRPRLKRDSNPQSRLPSERRQCMP